MPFRPYGRRTPTSPPPRKRPKTGGRQKGTPNKSTAAIREALLQVFADLQAGTGRENGHLLDWASGNSTDFYKLTTRLLPHQVTGEDGQVAMPPGMASDRGAIRTCPWPVITRIELVAPTAEDIERERGS